MTPGSERHTERITIGIAGAGAMGSQIAQLVSGYHHRVILYDNNPGVLTNAREKLKTALQLAIKDRRITQQEAVEQLGRVLFTQRLEDFRRSDFVIEAIIENLEGKSFLFSTLEKIVRPDVVFATNTSSLSVTSIAAACERRERVVGLHFLNPPAKIRLVELVRTELTSDKTLETVRKLAESWGKIVVESRDVPGFIVNRISHPYFGEALRILEEGIADPRTIDWAMRTLAGFESGPFELIDVIGNDTNLAITENLFAASGYEPRYRPSLIQRRLVEAGYLGQKTGRGFYDHSQAPDQGDKSAFDVTPELEELAGDISSRILSMLMNEAAFALFFGIAPADHIDLAAVEGSNFPKGLLHWADELGIEVVLGRISQLHEEYGEERYRPCPLLKRMASERMSFFSPASERFE